MESILVALLVLAASSSCIATQPAVRDFYTTVQLNVDTRGKVVKVGQPSHLPAVLVPAVRKAAALWRFKAPEVDGKAVTTTTWASVDVHLVKGTGNQYDVQVMYENNGPKVTLRYTPIYPMHARRRLMQGNVLMQASVEPDGSFADVHVVSLQGSKAGGFGQAARQAILRWQAQPMRLDGRPIVSHVQIAVHFSMCEVPCHRRMPLRHGVARKEPAWAHKPIGQFIATDSPLQRLPATGK